MRPLAFSPVRIQLLLMTEVVAVSEPRLIYWDKNLTSGDIAET
jgi:hypothetical protein